MKDKNIKNSIMDLINDDKVSKRSKYRFYFLAYFKILILFILGFVAVFFISLLGFISHIPVELLMLIAAIFIGLYLILSNEEIIKKTPRLYVWIFTLSGLLSIGFILNLINLHKNIIERVNRGSIMHHMYNHYEPSIYDKLHREASRVQIDIDNLESDLK